MSSYIWFIVAPIGVLIIYPDISNPYRILNFSIGIFLIIFIMSISLWLINLFKYNAPEWFNSQLRYDDSLRFRISDIWPIISGTVLIFYFVTYNNKLTIAIQNGMATAAATVAQSASAPDTIADMSKYDDLYQNIIRYFEKDRPYLDSGFNIAQLCSVLNTNTAYIYRAIKHNRNMTFSAFVALYRIEHVKDILRNNSDMYTIEYTYSSSGFSSQSTFNKTFKLIEGCTPSEYIESVKK
jgi:AraC-like DNA-binding protein